MSLTDLMSGFNLAFYAQAALIIFFVVFVVVVVRVLRRPKAEMSHHADLALDDAPDASVHSRPANSQEKK